MTTTRRSAPLAILTLTLAALAVTGCASSSSPSGSAPLVSIAATGPAAPPSAAAGPPAAVARPPSPGGGPPSGDAGAPAPAAGRTPRETAEQSEVGTAVKDGAVITKAVCYKSTVTYSAGSDTYTVSCDMTFSDGTVWNGLVTLLMASSQVSWQPQYQVS